MKAFLLLTLLLTGLVSAAPLPTSAAPAKATKFDPDSRARQRRHLRHQAKVRLRQYRHR